MTGGRWGKYYPQDINVEMEFVWGHVACLSKPNKLVADLITDEAVFLQYIAWHLFPDVLLYKRL